MPQFKYYKEYDYKGHEKDVKVCTDIGNIENIELDLDGADGELRKMQGFLRVCGIKADGERCVLTGEKPLIPMAHGFVFASFAFTSFPDDIKDCRLCSDPRVLYIHARNVEMLFGFHAEREAWFKEYNKIHDAYFKAEQKNDKEAIARLENEIDKMDKDPYPTESEWKLFLRDIPTREYAIEWLKKRRYRIGPILDMSHKGALERYAEISEELDSGKIKALDFGPLRPE